jgi:hypothetical protein
VCSGKAIYTTVEIEASLELPIFHRGQKYVISVDKSSLVSVNLVENSTIADSQDVMYQLLNIIIKDAFRDTDLKQIGKAPRFFDMKNPILAEKL